MPWFFRFIGCCCFIYLFVRLCHYKFDLPYWFQQVFPDMIFLILVLSQWFLAAWSVVGAVLYFRLFQGNRTCARECFGIIVEAFFSGFFTGQIAYRRSDRTGSG